ncbi:MAG: hypothetical protein UY35_C0014G0017 [Candidatus Saccharibacteria bacterium GW2011_GWC2_48_9]|nr:MAG: hypothetical protein UY35_C0014G0017 [Candidatus Saccharibacteria bacterium GW2011_GWC2_48_9]
MANLSWNEIQDRATEFASKWQGETYEKGESQSFWSDFLSVYGVDRRRHGAFFEYAIKKGSGRQGFIDMFWPGKLLAEQKSGGKDLTKASIQAYEYLETMPDHDLPHAIVLSDFASFLCIDLDTREQVEFTIDKLPQHVKLFGFMIEQQSKNLAEENPVNIKAAEAMASLHNQLKADNYTGHDLEVLLVRLVFCMFADDSGIFDHQLLQHYLANRTSDDGSDLGPRLMQVFQALNTPVDRRQGSLDEEMASLPYVNGGLFAESIQTPYFTSSMRTQLLEAMRLDWSKVSPAIFGSMFQGVMDAKARRNLGAHYTSEKNILRVIKPLFLDDLYVEFAHALAAGPRKKYDELRKFQDKLASLKFLDPACGSGNFLVITYRELRRLEHKVVAQLAKNSEQQDMFANAGEGVGTLKVNVDQMYGIEIDEFPSLVAQTAIWLTDHQMNMEYSHQSGKMFKRLPLTVSATIVHANALTTDWASVVAPSELSYILGNPPFLGKKEQSKEQKDLVFQAFNGVKSAGILDFVSAWYVKAAGIMKQNSAIQSALVSTNSIIQGEQVPVLWKYLFGKDFHINFLHQTFKWSNDAKGNAAVYCVIVGFGLSGKPERRIFEYEDIRGEPNEVLAKNINGYGIDAPSIFIENRSNQICYGVPRMNYGSMPIDKGNLILSQEDYRQLVADEPQTEHLVRRYVGGNEFINNTVRYCLWLEGVNPSDIRSNSFVMKRVEQTRAYRLTSERPQTLDMAKTPTLFGEIRQPRSDYLLLPKVSSENRNYMPIGFMSTDIIANGSSLVVPSASLYHFGVLQSTMHMAWMRTVSGRMKSDYQYSAGIVYNNFIWPEATEAQKTEISRLAQTILDARAQFPGSSLADLYDPLAMPPVLAKAHTALDKAVDRLYRREPFASEADRVTMLFEKYQEVTL